MENLVGFFDHLLILLPLACSLTWPTPFLVQGVRKSLHNRMRQVKYFPLKQQNWLFVLVHQLILTLWRKCQLVLVEVIHKNFDVIVVMCCLWKCLGVMLIFCIRYQACPRYGVNIIKFPNIFCFVFVFGISRLLLD